MSINPPPNPPKYSCTLCDCTFTRLDNMKRHMVNKHNTLYPINTTANSNLPTAKSSISTGKSSIPTGNSSISTAKSNLPTGKSNPEFTCAKCCKNFTRNWGLMKHAEKCEGVRNTFACEFCHKVFRHEKSKYKHYKVCTREQGSIETIPSQEIVNQPSVIHNNNNTIENQTQIQNQQNNNITIIYNPNQIEFKQDHITYDKLNSFLRLYPTIDREVFIRHFGLLLENPENMCIKKEDIKSGYSEVHVGNNEWELISDRKVYPNVFTSVANNLSDLVNTHRDKLPKPLQTAIIQHCDYMSEQGYANTGDLERDKEIEKEYKEGVREIKYEVHTKTRKKKKDV